jgi:hypothetical protein
MEIGQPQRIFRIVPRETPGPVLDPPDAEPAPVEVPVTVPEPDLVPA